MTGQSVRKIGGAAAVYILLAVVQTWPLSRHLSDRIPHDPGDPLLATYLLNWNALTPPLTERWWNAPFFWPAPDTMTLSDPFVGLAPATWAMRQAGLNAAGVYNVLYFTSFWLPALCMYLLAFTLTGSAVAAFVAGLAYGFAPYRAAHLSHLQLLLTPALPLMFLALHRTLVSPRLVWPMIAALCWLWQGLVGSYFLVFAPLAVLLWLAWFGDSKRVWTLTLAAFVTGAVLVWPIVDRYRQSHRDGGYTRPINEVARFSADLSALTQIPEELAVHVGPPTFASAEQDLFPGFTIVLLGVIALVSAGWAHGPPRRATLLLLLLFSVAVLLALVAAFHPIRVLLAGARISLTTPAKSLSVAWLALIAAILSSRTASNAWAERSLAAGYALIALALWILALGPFPEAGGKAIAYRAPYWLLYHYVPGFDGIRVPARLWGLVMLGLAVLAGLGSHRLLAWKRGPIVVAVLSVAIVAEGWIRALPLEPLPPRYPVPDAAELVLELPAGGPYEDAAAMYRSLEHRRPILNGYSGYQPASYRRLLEQIDAGDIAGIVHMARGKRLAIVLRRDWDGAPALYTRIVARSERCDEGAIVISCLMK